MLATEIISFLKKIIKGLIILNITLVLALIITICIFINYLSLYDFTNDNNQYVKDVKTIENSDITLTNK